MDLMEYGCEAGAASGRPMPGTAWRRSLTYRAQAQLTRASAGWAAGGFCFGMSEAASLSLGALKSQRPVR